MAWTDTTSYSRDSEDREPRTWELQVHSFRMVVTRHIDFPGRWLWACEPFQQQVWPDMPADEAKEVAVERLRSLLTGALAQLNTQEPAQ